MYYLFNVLSETQSSNVASGGIDPASGGGTAGPENVSDAGAKALGGAANSYLGSYQNDPTVRNNLTNLFS